MTLDATKVRTAVTGALWVAPIGTTLPTDFDGALDAAFKDVGYIGDGGVTEGDSVSTNSVKAWQNGAEVALLQTEFSLTYAFEMLETNPVVMAEYFGNYTTDGTDAEVQITADRLSNRSWVLEYVDGGITVRKVIPIGRITERGDRTIAGTDVVRYPATITVFPDTSGVHVYNYMPDLATA